MRRLVRPEVEALRAYDAHRPPASIRLDTHESPWDLPPELKERALARLRRLEFNRYPDPTAARLRELLAAYAGVDDPACIIPGNGSDELIQCLLLALAGERVVVPTPSFAMYSITAAVCGARPVPVPLADGFALDAEAVVKAARGARAVFIAYPNNPTGNCFDEEAIRCVLDSCDCTVVVDEAYHEFSGRTFVPEVAGRENLVVLRTLSKGFALAGIRLGYAVAPPGIARALDKVRLPYNVGSLGQAVAECALEEPGLLLRRAREIVRERERVFRELSAIPGVTPYPSDANFIMFRTRAGKVHEALLRRGVLIKNLDGPGLEGCLRVTIGSPGENDAFLDALRGALGEASGEVPG